VLAQIAALQQEKAARTPAEQKFSSRLLYAIKQQRGELPPGISLRLPSLAPDASGRIEVDIVSRAGTDLRAMLTSRNAAVTTWDLAEGRDGGEHEFHTFILLSNPQTTAANVTVTFLLEDGAPLMKDYVVGASSRLTIDARDVPELIDRAFGARIKVTNNMPILVERSMYWNANGVFWAGGSNAGGILVP
jgi:hypothetical protein